MAMAKLGRKVSSFTLWALVVGLIIMVAFSMSWVVKQGSYMIYYRSQVQQTITETVHPACLLQKRQQQVESID